MTTKEYLSQIRTIGIKIDQRKMQLEALYTAASGLKAITYDRDKVQTSASGDLLPDAVEKIVRLRETISAMVLQLEERRSEIVNQIQALDDARYIDILHMRYVEDRTLEAISCRMGYSYFRVRHLHGEALEAFRSKHKIGTSRHTKAH